MQQVIIVKSGEGYSDSEYTFEKESDAIDFFKAIGKAKKLRKDYITGNGYIYYLSDETAKASLVYGNFASDEELSLLRKEEARIKAEKEAAEAPEDRSC